MQAVAGEEGCARAFGIDGRDNFSQTAIDTVKRHRQSDIVRFILTVAYGSKFITNRGRGCIQGVYVLFLDVRTTRQHAAY